MNRDPDHAEGQQTVHFLDRKEYRDLMDGECKRLLQAAKSPAATASPPADPPADPPASPSADPPRGTSWRLFNALRGAGTPRDPHELIAEQVFRRLRLRHIQLMAVEHEALQYEACSSNEREPAESGPAATPTKRGFASSSHPRQAQTAGGRETDAHSSGSEDECRRALDPATRAYHLAVTDLFVEKAIAYLEDHAEPYKTRGKWYSLLAILVTALGAVLALALLLWPEFLSLEDATDGAWQFASVFSKSFTAIGMIVLVAALLWRHGKANLDQAERLMERRHALRQGRLFVHLNGGRLTIDQMEKAFNWNYTQSNAFANIKDDTQAPWGAVTKELAASAADLIRAGIQAVVKSSASSDAKGDGGQPEKR